MNARRGWLVGAGVLVIVAGIVTTVLVFTTSDDDRVGEVSTAHCLRL